LADVHSVHPDKLCSRNAGILLCSSSEQQYKKDPN
jgi:hypothetical protein